MDIDNKKYSEYLIEWLKIEVKAANKKGVIVGLSGGIDSSLVAALAVKSFGKNALGVSLEINSMEKDLVDIQKLIANIKIEYKHVNLKMFYETLLKTLNLQDNLSQENLKPRLRMMTLYALAQEKNYLVLGTDNLAELYLGYFTKYGDGAADLLPIIQMIKSEVNDMSKYMNIPDSIIEKKPSAGLWENQYDEDELGFTYKQVDAFLKGKKVDPSVVKKIKLQNKNTQHKRDEIHRPLSYGDMLKGGK